MIKPISFLAALVFVPALAHAQTRWTLYWNPVPESERVFAYNVYYSPISTNGPTWTRIVISDTPITNVYPVFGSSDAISYSTNVVSATTTNNVISFSTPEPNIWVYVSAINPWGEGDPSETLSGFAGQPFQYSKPSKVTGLHLGQDFSSPGPLLLHQQININVTK